MPLPASRRSTLLLFGAIVVTVLAWASAFVVIRGTAVSFHPGSLALGRLLVGTAALALMFAGRRWVRPNRREWVLILVYGIGWFGAYNIALNTAETTLDAGTTAMIVSIGPILIAVGGAVVLREPMSRWRIIGVAAAFLGVVLIGISAGAGFGDGIGVIWCLVAAVTFAAGVIAQKPLLRRLPSGQLTLMGCAIGMITTLPFSGQLVADVAAAPVAATLGVIYLGVVPTALAFTTWGYALGRMPASQLGISTYVVPPITIVLGLIAFGEVPAPLALVGGIVCLTGVAVSRRVTRPRTAPTAVPASPRNLPQ